MQLSYRSYCNGNEMVLLARKLDQLVVMDDIKITIVKARRGYVQIDIKVTDDVRLHREVIYKMLKAEAA